MSKLYCFAQNGFRVSATGYFVYCNGKTDRHAFDGKLEFDVVLLPYTGNTDCLSPHQGRPVALSGS